MRAMSLSRRSFSWLCSSEPFPSLQLRFFNSGNDGGRIRNDSSFESVDDFERRLFGDIGDGADTGSFFRRLDKIEKDHGRYVNGWRDIDGGNSGFMNNQSEGFDTLSDGMDSKLKKAATSFEFSAEIMDDDYQFRPDVTFRPGTTYTPKDLDLTKPGIPRPFKRTEFETTTAEVLKKADFRNVRFLSNFLTEAGIIIKRSQTKISAKAQRKVAREIKTARALGLMPFTTMGTKPFIFGRTMQDDDEEFSYDSYGISGSAALDDVQVDVKKFLPR